MQYMLFIIEDESRFDTMPRDEMGALMGRYQAYTEAMAKAGVLVGGERLHPGASATTVKVREGKAVVLSGPYADTLEQIGGYYTIDVPDLDAAIEWARQCPGAESGTMEIRPVFPT